MDKTPSCPCPRPLAASARHPRSDGQPHGRGPTGATPGSGPGSGPGARPSRRRIGVTALLAAMAFGAFVPAAGAQTPAPSEPASVSAWPTRPVTLIVPFAAGGPTDTVARLLAERLQQAWGRSVVVDYRAGAGTIVGTQAVAQAAPDGHTLGMAITALMINPGLQPKLPYDTTRDLVGVSQVAQAHFGLFAHPSLPADDVAGLVRYARANPGRLSYATPGIGTGTHLAGEMLKHQAGLDWVHVPYKGSAPAQQDVIAGRVPVLFDVLFSSMPFVKDGRLKVLALSSPARAKVSPEIPLVSETIPGFAAMSFIGVIAPAAVPKALLDRISADIARAVQSPELTQRMT
jgi:tripartite-type tricarboxylate transporter receptor subunit TctC